MIGVMLLLLTASPEAARLAQEAASFAQAGQLTQARERLDRAVAIDPQDATLQFNLAQVCEALHEDEAAVRSYRAYLALSPRAPDAADVNKRIARLEAAPLVVPPEARDRVFKAQALVRMGRTEEAMRELEQARDTAPKWPDARFNLAVVYEQLGHFAAAAAELRVFRDLSPESDNAKTNEKLAELRIKADDADKAAAERKRQEEAAAAQRAEEARKAALARQAAARQAELDRANAVAAARKQAIQNKRGSFAGAAVGLGIPGLIFSIGGTIGVAGASARFDDIRKTGNTSDYRKAVEGLELGRALMILGGAVLAASVVFIIVAAGVKDEPPAVSLRLTGGPGGGLVQVQGNF